jgi:hypothetical protein
MARCSIDAGSYIIGGGDPGTIITTIPWTTSPSATTPTTRSSRLTSRRRSAPCRPLHPDANRSQARDARGLARGAVVRAADALASPGDIEHHRDAAAPPGSARMTGARKRASSPPENGETQADPLGPDDWPQQPSDRKVPRAPARARRRGARRRAQPALQPVLDPSSRARGSSGLCGVNVSTNKSLADVWRTAEGVDESGGHPRLWAEALTALNTCVNFVVG